MLTAAWKLYWYYVLSYSGSCSAYTYKVDDVVRLLTARTAAPRRGWKNKRRDAAACLENGVPKSISGDVARL